MSFSAIDIKSWDDAYDKQTGLWWQETPGHTAPVAGLARGRPIPSAASRLLLAAEAKLLDAIEVNKVLEAIANAQEQEEGPTFGCFRWYYEEIRPVDTNAAFFIGMNLIALRLTHFNDLDGHGKVTLSRMLTNLLPWFQRAVSHKGLNYPNKYLGDLVCCWLLMEINNIDDDDNVIQQAMIDAAQYWAHNHWGWGEHLSDVYSNVILDQLSMLLTLSRNLPQEVRFNYQRLFDKLLTLEDQFDGPRVPAIRSYAFTQPPQHSNYRDGVIPLEAPPARSTRVQHDARNELMNRFSNRPPLGSVLAARGWHDMARERQARAHALRVRCFGEAMAVAQIEKDIRLGSMSKFPIMPCTDHQNWGLSWQSFPLAIWRPDGDWAYLQWETRAGSRIRAHPAEDKRSAYLGNALAQSVNPAIVGHTYSIQQGGDVLCLRLMPIITAEWDSLHDRLRLIHGTAELVNRPDHKLAHDFHWGQRLLVYDGRVVSCQCIPLIANVTPEPFKRETFDGGQALDWDVVLDRDRLVHLRCVPILWGFSLSGEITDAPVITILPDPTAIPRQPEERKLQIHWVWGTSRWDVTIDPLASEPLKEI